jgi:hypothetical protein
MRTAGRRRVSCKGGRMVLVVGCIVAFNKVADQKEVQQKFAVHLEFSYKAFSHKLVSIINYIVIPS